MGFRVWGLGFRVWGVSLLEGSWGFVSRVISKVIVRTTLYSGHLYSQTEPYVPSPMSLKVGFVA